MTSFRLSVLDINFAHPSLRRSVAKTSFITWLVLIAAMAICILSAYRAVRIEQSKLEKTKSIQHLQRTLEEKKVRSLPTKTPSLSSEQITAINQAIKQLNLPWSDLFDAVEDSVSPTIALLRIAPDTSKQLIRFQAETKDVDQMIAYIEKLKASKYFTGVRITRHEIYELDPNRPIRFQFEAGWAKDVN